jgi:hypothetical protein
MHKQLGFGLALAALAAGALAAESRVTGNLQLQGAYLDPALSGKGRWYLQSPNSWLGLEVREQSSGSQYRAVLEADLNPLSFSEPATSRQMFLEWAQPLYSIRGGKLRSLEQQLLVSPVSLMHGYAGESTDSFKGGLAIENYSVELEQPGIEFTASNGELVYVSGQWTFADENSASSLEQWAVATGLDTPEGSVALTYRSNDDGGLWGTSIMWRSEGLQLGGGTLYRDELLAWDLLAAYQAGTVISKLTYGRDELPEQSGDSRYWAFGIDRVFSEAILNYSEIRWQPEPEQWRWMTGFRLTF